MHFGWIVNLVYERSRPAAILEEDPGVGGPILRCACDVAFHRETAEERPEFKWADLVRMPFLVLANKRADPAQTTRLGSEAAMSHAGSGRKRFNIRVGENTTVGGGWFRMAD